MKQDLKDLPDRKVKQDLKDLPDRKVKQDLKELPDRKVKQDLKDLPERKVKQDLKDLRDRKVKQDLKDLPDRKDRRATRETLAHRVLLEFQVNRECRAKQVPRAIWASAAQRVRLDPKVTPESRDHLAHRVNRDRPAQHLCPRPHRLPRRHRRLRPHRPPRRHLCRVPRRRSHPHRSPVLLPIRRSWSSACRTA